MISLRWLRTARTLVLILALVEVTSLAQVAERSGRGGGRRIAALQDPGHGSPARRPMRADRHQTSDPTAVQAAHAAYPLSFEKNEGQAAGPARFLARGRGYTLFLTPSEAVLELRSRAVSYESRSADRGRSLSSRLRSRPDAEARAVLRFQLVGADPDPDIAGLDELPGKSHYFIGNDPARWRCEIPTYARVRYRNVYPAVDLVYYGNQRRLEYDFIVAPGGDPRAVRFAVAGADRARVDSGGDLVLRTAGGELRLRRPDLYQEVGGARRPVAGGYTLRRYDGRLDVGFRVGDYDLARPLVIDPVLDYSTYLGGTGVEAGTGVGVDSDGNVYITGTTSDGAKLPGPGATFATKLNPAAGAGSDAFVIKLDKSTGAIVYSTYFGGANDDVAAGIAVSPSGIAHVVGYTTSNDFPATPDGFDKLFNISGCTLGCALDAFELTLAPNGGLQFATYLGGDRDDLAHGVAVDASSENTVYVTGTTWSSDFPVKNYIQNQDKLHGSLGAGLDRDAFVVKLDVSSKMVFNGCTIDGTSYNNCDDLLYSTYLGGTAIDDGFGIAATDMYGVLVTGQTCSTTASPFLDRFPTASSYVFDSQPRGGCDAFLSRVTTDGAGKAGLAYSTYLGGSAWDLARGVAFDGARAVVTGETASTDFPVKKAVQAQHGGGTYDVFVAALSAGIGASTSLLCTINGIQYNNCNDLRYATYLGGKGDDYGFAAAGAFSGFSGGPVSAYVTGQTCSVFDPNDATQGFPLSNPLTKDTVNHVNDGTACDAFVTRLNVAGGLSYSTYLGGGNSEIGGAIAVDFTGRKAHVAGTTLSSNFPLGAKPAAQPTSAGGPGEAFVAKLTLPASGGGPYAYMLPSVIDTATDTLVDMISGTGGTGIAVHPDGSRVYTAKDMTTVSFIDPATKQVPDQNVTGANFQSTSGAAVGPDGTKLYVPDHPDVQPNNIYVFNALTGQFLPTIQYSLDDPMAGVAGFGVVVHPDGTRLYVANNHGGTVDVISTSSQTKLKSIPLNQANAFGAWGITVTPDGQWVYVANKNNDCVQVIKTADDTLFKTIQDLDKDGDPMTMFAPKFLAVTPKKVPSHGYLVYVTAGFSSPGLTVIDSDTQDVLTTVPDAGGFGLTVTPDGTKVYVNAGGFSSLLARVIDVATNQWVESVFAPINSELLGSFIGPQDRDGDGIIDQIDGTVDMANTFTHDSAFSNDFTDKHLGGTSYGSIVKRNGLKVTVWNRFEPGGFYARATGGAGTAQINHCGTDVFLTDNNEVKVLCGSLTLEVVNGPVKIALGAGTFASVPTGGAVKVVELSTGQFQVENLGTTTVTVVDAQGNVLFSIPAGKSATFEACPCSGPSSGGAWKNHGEYVTCVEKSAAALFKSGLITEKKRGEMVSAAAKSDCGAKK